MCLFFVDVNIYIFAIFIVFVSLQVSVLWYHHDVFATGLESNLKLLTSCTIRKLLIFQLTLKTYLSVYFCMEYQWYPLKFHTEYSCTYSVFSCDQAALSIVQSLHPSVRHTFFHYVPIIVSSWNFQELLPLTEVISMQEVKVRGQRSRVQRSKPNLAVPDRNSSLNSHMAMKWYTKLEVA